MPVGTSLTVLSNILKEFYLGPVVEQLNNEVLLLQRLESRDQEIFGKAAFIPLHTGRSGGIGPAPESGALPVAGAQSYARAQYDLKYLYGRVRVTGPSMAKTASEAGAFLQALKGELDGIRADLKKDLSRQVYGDGTAQICACGVTTASTTVVLNATSGAEAIRHGFLYVGMVVDIGSTADYDSISGVGGREITAVNLAGPSIVISGGNVTTAGTDVISRSGGAGQSSASVYEIDAGLQKIVSNAANTVGLIDGSLGANAYWNNIRDNVAGALSTDRMMQNWNQVQVNGGSVSAVITSYGLQRAYFNLLQGQVRYVEPLQIKGGFSVLEFMQKPLIADVDAPFGKMFFLDERFLKVFSNRDWHFLDEDGNVLKWVTGFDQWEAVLARYMNLGASRRNTHAVMFGLTDATGV